MDFLQEAEALSAELSALRQELHREPELGNREWKTAQCIERYLHALDIPTSRPFGTAVVGTLSGAQPGRAAALRADMDALPIEEDTGAPFASQNPGVMHACGHDIHMTAALGAARLLAAHRDKLHGAVVFLFQPDEEGDGGAQRLIEAGALDRVDAVFGAHVSPELPLGHIGVRYGKFYAASNLFRVIVHGSSCHGAEREKGADALLAAAKMIPTLISLQERFPGEHSVVSVGTLHSGTADNIVPDRAEFTGIIRTLGPDTRAAMLGLVTEAISRIARETGTTAELRLRESYPGVVNHDGMTRFVQETASAVLGSERVHVIERPTMTTEDFGYYLLERPGSFYSIGAGCSLPLHNRSFLPDARAAVTAAAVHAAVLYRYLCNNN